MCSTPVRATSQQAKGATAFTHGKCITSKSSTKDKESMRGRGP
jgi:hypothetical protein